MKTITTKRWRENQDRQGICAGLGLAPAGLAGHARADGNDTKETKQGLNLEIVDQDGRSMSADGSKKRLTERLAIPRKQTLLRIFITRHTAAGSVPVRSDYGPFGLLADRANAVRRILETKARRSPKLAQSSQKGGTTEP